MSSLAAKTLAVWEILQESDEGHPLSAPMIVALLQSRYGIIAERKSIYRLIQQTFIGEMGLDIAMLEGAKGGYYLCSRKYEDWQVKLLIDAVESARFLSEDDARDLIQTLLGESSAPSRKALSLMGRVKPVSRSQDRKTRYAIDTILQAIQRDRMVRFRYLTVNEQFEPRARKSGKIYLFAPYRLFWQDDRYYVVGNTDGYADLSIYRPDRMIDVSVDDIPARDITELLGKNAQDALNEYLQRIIYRYQGEDVSLKLRCKKGMEADILDQFGKPRSVRRLESGFECTIPTQNSEGLLYWLLQNGDSIKVLAPAAVRESLIQALRQTLSQYDDE